VKENESLLTGTLLEGAVYQSPQNMFNMMMKIIIRINMNAFYAQLLNVYAKLMLRAQLSPLTGCLFA